ncbi:hypothetical protein STRAU_0031 [Streptomyces aurantiacus JA 4570]|uniref:Uncharacterized protein n=1 Tax=Streptomyces aurantiacus JA 4570 TaxID=1286094 RepID=S4A7U7_9ACTN|nr:hypothetical protein STRAU_0031 [Streptomyces aurantiacus JA 4570]
MLRLRLRRGLGLGPGSGGRLGRLGGRAGPAGAAESVADGLVKSTGAACSWPARAPATTSAVPSP